MKKSRLRFPKYLNLKVNLNGEIHSILDELKDSIEEDDIDSAKEIIQEHLQNVINDLLENELNEKTLIRNTKKAG